MHKIKYYLFCTIFIISIISFILLNISYKQLFVTRYSLILAFISIGLIILNIFLNKSKFKFLILCNRVLNGLIILFIIFVTTLKIAVYNESKNTIPIKKSYDYIVVLGAGLKGKEPGYYLQKRLDKAIQYLKLDNKIKIIVSGGQGPDEEISEALAMKNYLLKNGVPKKQIFMESLSTTTYENLKFSKELAFKNGVKNPKFLIVSTDFHLYRAKFLASILNLDVDTLGSKSQSIVIINRTPKEAYLILLSYFETIALP